MRKVLLIIMSLLISMNCSDASDNLKVLDSVNSPSDIKKMNITQLNDLAEDIRYAIVKRANTIGGHLGPDLGFVEPTIALHYVFNSPKDQIVFDVSHQCYPHKILTGRKSGFLNPNMYFVISGYTNPKESEHDMFSVGHTSTGISLATGLAKGRDINKASGNVIAVVGDGSLSGGEAYEGLNNAAVLGSNIIIVVNDNEMAIAENHGGLYKNLALLRETNGTAENNIFKAMGFEYVYVENGNNIQDLISAFRTVKDSAYPVVVHLHTLKGKGFEPAEIDKEKYHYIFSGALDEPEKTDVKKQEKPVETYNDITTQYLLYKKKTDPNLVVISPATPGATGLTKDIRDELGNNYVDVGIAEEHAIAFASGIAKNGGKPVLEVMSSFVQRTYDQLSQDLALNNSPATILVFAGGIYGADATHLGIFDISMMSNIPNLVYMAPTNKEEYLKILDWSVNQTDYPVAIRVPSGKVTHAKSITDRTNYSKLNKYKVMERGSEIAIIAAGDFYDLGYQVKNLIYKKLGIRATLINPVYLTGIDEKMLNDLKAKHKIVITLESGIIDGGFGEKITRYYTGTGMKVLNFGARKEFTDRMTTEELYKRYHLTPELIVKDVSKNL